MKLRICLGLWSVVLLSTLFAACGGDDAPPLDVDAGSTDLGGADAGLRDAALDANRADAAECVDVDSDGHADHACGGDDCDDSDSTRYPSATELCDLDDEDCNDATHGPDADGDSFVSLVCCNGAGNCGADCDDTDSTVHPGVSEVCNGGIDDDCNGLADLAEGVCVPCGDGLTGFDGECTDVNECTAGAPCGGFSGTTCENTYGSYVCHCPNGYTAPAAGGTCVDLNECDASVCGTGMATCVNSVGSYACTCNSGWTVLPGGGAPCVDLDECAAGTPCGVGFGTCENRDGTYACTCSAGYEAPTTGGACDDIDECARGTNDCDASATCTNAVPGFRCPCPPGVGGAGHGAGSCSGPRFTDLGGGLVRDNNGSGLVWQQAVDADLYHTQAGAIAYCASLALDGGGWRLPTKDELSSIVDTRFYPTIDPTYFPGTGDWWLWSSSPVAGSPSLGWVVHFNDGSASQYGATSSVRARCVR